MGDYRPLFLFMPKSQSEPVGSKQERELFTEVLRHYSLATEDLQVRKPDWDKKDELFRSHINESGWPYSSVVFDPRVFTAIFEKTSRLLANKPRGRMVPREGGDSLGAHINNEILKFQWDENERVDSYPMLAKWAMMDMNARKYGASFALCKWHYQRMVKRNGEDVSKATSKVYYDGPNFKPLVNRDVLVNPSYSTVKMWFQHRDYLTLSEMENVNDAARTKPIYKNLDLLSQKIKDKDTGGGDSRASNYSSRNKTILGLTDTLGQDEYNKVIEVVTEYRPESWVTFAPKHGVILRDIPNPYEHGQIPVVMLKYYPVDDDIYGMSEIEPVERLQKGVNALINQYLDAINMSLYTPLKVRSTGVQMHTLEFGPGKKWLMNDPMTDVVPFDQSPTGVTEFSSTYRFMIGAMQEGLGETSAGTSNLDPGQTNKTATEIQDLATQRNARDNFNQIFLSEAIKKQMMFWHLMDRQFLFDNPKEHQKIIRIAGKDAIKYFQTQGLDQNMVSDQAAQLMADPNIADLGINPQELATPQFPVNVGGETIPKFSTEPGGESGSLILEKDDMSGEYDYIPDIESMKLPNDQQILGIKQAMLNLMINPASQQLLAQEGYKVKFKELVEDSFEVTGMKDADKYFEKVQTPPAPGGMNNGQSALPAGAGGPQAVPAFAGPSQGAGVPAGAQTMA